TLDEAGYGFDILVAQLGGDGAHDHRVAVVGAVAFTEIGQLLGYVLSVLATQFREAGSCQASAVRRMATGAGRHAFFQLAAAEQRFTTLDQLGIGSTDTHLLAGEVGGDIGQILIAEVVQHTGHFNNLAIAGLDVVQLLEQVALALAGQLGEVWRGAVAIGAMAGTTDSDLALTGFGIASSLSHSGEAQGQQQTHEYFVHQLIQLRLREKGLSVRLTHSVISLMTAW